MESQVTARLSSDLKKALDEASKRMNVKASEIVRIALQQFLGKPGPSEMHPADRVRGLLGSLDTGIPDLAEKHREYILESLKRGE